MLPISKDKANRSKKEIEIKILRKYIYYFLYLKLVFLPGKRKKDMLKGLSCGIITLIYCK